MPMPGKFCPADAPDDFFRIRLVCTLLDTCGLCFDRGSAKRKMDFFLTFFQYYIQTKDPLPMDMEFVVQDTYQLLRPNWKLLTNLEEAAKTFQEAVAKTYKQDEQIEQDEEDEESSGEDGEVEDLADLEDHDGDSDHDGEEEDSVSLLML